MRGESSSTKQSHQGILPSSKPTQTESDLFWSHFMEAPPPPPPLTFGLPRHSSVSFAGLIPPVSSTSWQPLHVLNQCDSPSTEEFALISTTAASADSCFIIVVIPRSRPLHLAEPRVLTLRCSAVCSASHHPPGADLKLTISRVSGFCFRR